NRYRGHWLLTRRSWAFFANPFRNTPVDDGDAFVAHPAQQPPQTAREHPVVLIVRNDLHPRADAESYKRLDEHVGIGQRMTAVHPGQRSGEILVEMRVDGTGDMGNEILTRSPRFVGELEAAIYGNPL